MCKCLTLLILSFMLSACSASNSPTGGSGMYAVTGTVRDTSGALIMGATVLIEMDVIFSTHTDSLGQFKFENIPVGRYPIRATTTHFSTDSQTVIVTSGGVTPISFSVFRVYPPVPESGLVCLYRFTGNVLDSTPHHHDGSPTGCGYVTDRFGQAEGAVYFSNTNNFVNIADAPDLNFGDSSDFTICFWMNAEQLPGSAYAVSKMNPSKNDVGYRVEILGNFMRGYVGTTSGTTTINFGSPGSGTWRFIAMVVSGKTSLVSAWIDGQVVSKTIATELGASSANIWPVTTGHFPGAMDDLRIYNRALGAEEISELYHEWWW